jgi:hypothetical protein
MWDQSVTLDFPTAHADPPEQKKSPGGSGATAETLAHRILWAAGFERVGLYLHTWRGCVDLGDGAKADDFED